MKKITFVFLIVILLLAFAPRTQLMAIDFASTADQRVDFGTVAPVQNLASKTFVFWATIDATTDGNFFALNGAGAGDELWVLGITSTKVRFLVDWSTALGLWDTNSALTTGRHMIAVSYSNSATANDPIIYVDGAAVAITELSTPAGTYSAGTTNTMRLGSYSAGLSPVNCKLENMLIYNRILTAAEIAEAYASRLAIPSYRGLVFAPLLIGAATAQTYDGTTLTSAHLLRDSISGATGTPNASPVGVGDSFLTYP